MSHVKKMAVFGLFSENEFRKRRGGGSYLRPWKIQITAIQFQSHDRQEMERSIPIISSKFLFLGRASLCRTRHTFFWKKVSETSDLSEIIPFFSENFHWKELTFSECHMSTVGPPKKQWKNLLQTNFMHYTAVSHDDSEKWRFRRSIQTTFQQYLTPPTGWSCRGQWGFWCVGKYLHSSPRLSRVYYTQRAR